MIRKHVLSRIQEIGIIPAIRVSSMEDASFAAKSIFRGGILVVEIAVTVPGITQLISALHAQLPEMIVGVGSVHDPELGRECVAAGAMFLTTDGLVPEVIELAKRHDVAVFPGALSPAEILAAWRAGADLVKVFPCSAFGGESYVRTLKASVPEIPLIAAGGVNQQTATGYITAGAAALGISTALFPREAIELRQEKRIQELARRFTGFVTHGRKEYASTHGHPPAPSEPEMARLASLLAQS